MVYFSVIFLCNALLFMILPVNKFKFITTAITFSSGYLSSLLLAQIIKIFVRDTAVQEIVCVAANLIILYILSLFLCGNNPVQKLYLFFLCLSNFTFLRLFTELLLGVMPFRTAGVFSGFFSVAVYIFFSLFTGLCLYRVFHHFSDREISRFSAGITVLQIFPCLLCTGVFDFLFAFHHLAGRIILSAVAYLLILFMLRSVYGASKFRENAAAATAHERLIETQSGRFSEMLANVREVRMITERNDYALDAISVMILDNAQDKIPNFIREFKKHNNNMPILNRYHSNPYINAVIATNAALAEQDGIQFECNAAIGENRMRTSELCIIINELLHKAYTEASDFDGEKQIHFKISSLGEVVDFEAIYTAHIPHAETFSYKGKKLQEIIDYLFDETEKQPLTAGLGDTEEIVSRYSGKVNISSADTNMIVHAVVNC